MICFFESHFLRTTSETRLKEDRGTFPRVLRPVTALKRKAGKLFALLFWAKMALEKQVRNSKVNNLQKKCQVEDHDRNIFIQSNTYFGMETKITVQMTSN